MPEIEYIDFDEMIVCTTDGQVAEITNCFDEDGDDCDFEFAVSCVSGPFDFGWIHFVIDELEPVRVH